MAAEPDNGVLALVKGEDISAAMGLLPAPGAGAPPLAQSSIVTGNLGTVALDFRLTVHKHGRNRHWFWVATHAAQV